MADDNTSDKQLNNTSDKPWLWKPGESGNPNGRPPKGHSITDTIRAMMDEKPEIKKALGAKILQSAADGDITAMKLIWNYLDGMPTQKQEVSGPEGKPLKLNIISYGNNDTLQLPATPTHGQGVERLAPVPSLELAPEGSEDNTSDK